MRRAGLGVRVDCALYAGYMVPPHYDSLVAKLVVHAPTRAEAIARLRRALDEMVVGGIRTTLPLHQRDRGGPGIPVGRLHHPLAGALRGRTAGRLNCRRRPAVPCSACPVAPGHTGRVSRRQIDITPDLMLRAYRAGLFPMAESRGGERLYWLDPERRGVIPLDAAFHLPKRLLRTVLSGPYRVTADADFRGVITGCAAPAPGREDTWINPEIEQLFLALHRQGHAHSVEVWQGRRWSAGSTAWCSAPPSSARACSAVPATPPRSRWCIWWRGCGSGASRCWMRSS